MKKKEFAKTADEFDVRFDAGEDIHDLIDVSRARTVRPNKKVRITLDISESLDRDIDTIRERIRCGQRRSHKGVATRESIERKITFRGQE